VRAFGDSRVRLRRRGPGEDSTGRPGLARRFCYTPWEYTNDVRVRPSAGNGASRRSSMPSAASCGATASIDTLPRSDLSSAGRRRAVRFRAPGAFACLLGQVIDRPRGRMERIPNTPYEADLSAQEAPPRKGARLPRQDEDGRRPPGPGRTSRSRSKTADSLTIGRGPNSPRLVMLSRPQDFAALQGGGTTRSHPLLTARFQRTDLETTRFGLSTGRALGGAVVRNRVRRRLREALRVMAPSFQPGWDVLIIARPTIVTAGHDALVGALRRTLAKGGVLGGSAG
jgi:ribonuclease P protein component